MIKHFENTGVLKTHDWHRVRMLFNQIVQKVDQGQIDSLKYQEPNWGGHIYGFDGHGSMVRAIYHNGTWDTWCGKLLEKSIPWGRILRQRLQSLEIGFQHFSFARHDCDLDAHIDYPSDGEVLPGSCNLNFVVTADDPEAYTYIDHEGQRYSHPSIVGTAWLLNTYAMHGVINNGTREVFTMRFHAPFHTVSDVLAENPDILVI